MIKVETKYDEESIKKLIFLKMRIIEPFYIIFSVLFSLIGLAFISNGIVVFGVIYLVLFGIGFCPICFEITFICQSSINKTERLLVAEIKQIFEFEEKKFTIESKSIYGFEEKTDMIYKFVYKSYETKKDFFLMLSKNKTFVVPKMNMTAEDIEQVRKILRANTTFKKFCK